MPLHLGHHLHFQLPPALTSMVLFRPAYFCFPIVMVKSSVTLTRESDSTCVVYLCVICMSLGMLSQKGFIILT